jgi:FkbM family methyltransferase
MSSRLFQILPGILGDGRFDRSLPVRYEGREVFRIYDFGSISRMRSESFETKEPETLRWISGFPKGSRLVDVGANVGLFSLFAASRGCDVVSVEPDALNYALLQKNIRLNQTIVGERIRSYSVALHRELKVSTLNLSSSEWGGALSSFDNEVDFKGDAFAPLHRQGSVGMRLDELIGSLQFEPTHLKIDVDGNEGEVLEGAVVTLGCRVLCSVLIEFDERRPDYEACCRMLEKAGFVLAEKTHSDIYTQGRFSSSYNHIFVR